MGLKPPVSAGSSGAGKTFQATTAYKAGDVIQQAGSLWYANADFTSGASFSSANWTKVKGDDFTDQSVKARHASDMLRTGGWMPTGAVDQTIVDRIAGGATTITSGVLRLVGGIVIPGGRACSSITFMSSSTAAVTPTNQWFCLIDRATLAVLATTVDDTTNAWAATTAKTLQFATTIGGATPGGSYTPANAVEAYLGICVVATTVPNLTAGSFTVTLNAIPPMLTGSSNTGLTGPASLPATINAVGGAFGTIPMAWIS